MKRIISRTAGFTFIELLVSLSIVMMLVGGLLSGFNSFNQNRVVQQASLTLKANLRLAQSRALSALKPLSGCDELVGYQVSFTSNTYQIQALCTDGITQSLVGAITDITLPALLTFSTTPNAMTFGVLTKGIVGASGPVTITIVGISRQYQLVVSANGDITDIGFQDL